jgi:hypothetical protein
MTIQAGGEREDLLATLTSFGQHHNNGHRSRTSLC